MENHQCENPSDNTHKAKATISRRTKIIAAVAAAVVLLCLAAFCSHSDRKTYGKSLPVSEAFDSLASMLPKGSVIVARFPDEARADLYYLNSGVLYCFNGKSKFLEEVVVPGVKNGLIMSAKLSQDETYMTLTVREDKFDRLFRLNTMNRNIVDLEKSTAVADDMNETENKTPRQTEAKPEVPEITEPLPEAAFADEPTGAGHEEKKEAEPKKSHEPANAPEVITIPTD